ncbi:MAG: acyl carrier protein [Flavobacteriales bacterium]|nr:acyl carrier protein [Flavobacteriales bacterium]
MKPLELKARIVHLLTDRLARMGMSESDLSDDMDLVRSGLLDSLAFIDLITALEKEAGKELDQMRLWTVRMPPRSADLRPCSSESGRAYRIAHRARHGRSISDSCGIVGGTDV